MPKATPNDPLALALLALATAVSDERRARRFLDLSGMGTDELRARAGDPVLLAALIRFLEAHEPDLVAVAETMQVAPQALVEARRKLEEQEQQ